MRDDTQSWRWLEGHGQRSMVFTNVTAKNGCASPEGKVAFDKIETRGARSDTLGLAVLQRWLTFDPRRDADVRVTTRARGWIGKRLRGERRDVGGNI